MKILESLTPEGAEAIGFGLLGKVFGLVISAGKGMAFDAGFGTVADDSAAYKDALAVVDDIVPSADIVFQDNKAAMAYWLQVAEIVKTKAPLAASRQTLGETAKHFIKTLYRSPSVEELEALSIASGIPLASIQGSQQLQRDRQITFQVPLIQKAIEYAVECKPSTKKYVALDQLLKLKLTESFAGARRGIVKTKAPEEALAAIAFLNQQEAAIA